MAKKLNSRLVWMPSVSTDVVEQKLVVNVDDVEVVNEVLGPMVAEFPLILGENNHVVAVLDCSDGTFRSEAVSLDTVTGDFSAPEAPTGLNLVVDSVEDV